jgi:succinyl-CoA synthetase beta subunit
LHEGLTDAAAAKICTDLGFEGKTHSQGIEQLQKIYKMFLSVDATQIEVNPWAVTPDLDVYCVDAKINVDENAEFRQKEIVEAHEQSDASADVDANEQKAVKEGLNYIALDGNIGCMVNGAGLAMSTMDIIQLKGGMPANFLDVGGSANTNQVKTAFEILSSHPKVKGIFVNIFGGIMKCDTIANGIMEASKQVEVKVPITVRLVGTNADLAHTMITDFVNKNPKIKMSVISDFDKAAQHCVEVAK